METTNQKTFRPEPMKAGIGTNVNYELDVLSLAGLETGRDRKYQMPPRHVKFWQLLSSETGLWVDSCTKIGNWDSNSHIASLWHS